MTEMSVTYLGDLRCRMKHESSGVEIVTDAPKDNHGKGESFSPSDLTSSSVAACMMTIMGIKAKQHDLDLTGLEAKVIKEMVTEPERRIGRIVLKFNFPRSFEDKYKVMLERAAMTCPVHKSLNPKIETPVEFIYPE